MSLGEGVADFCDLARRLVGAEVDSSANCHCAQVASFFYGTKQNLVKLVREGQQLVMVNLHYEGNLMRILACHNAEHPKRRSDGIAATFDRQLHNVFRIEVLRVRCKRCTGRM